MDSWSIGGALKTAHGCIALNSLTTDGTEHAKLRDIVVRPSNDEDVQAMLAIYAHHVQRGLGEFDYEPLDGNDIKRRRKNMVKHRLPHLVAAYDGTVIGYAYAVPFRKRPAYRYAVKHSIYVHPDHLNAGVGRLLLPALIEACTAAGYRQMIAYIDVANLPSQRLHDMFGFERAGLLKDVGFKYGRWTDSILMQRARTGRIDAPGRCRWHTKEGPQDQVKRRGVTRAPRKCRSG